MGVWGLGWLAKLPLVCPAEWQAGRQAGRLAQVTYRHGSFLAPPILMIFQISIFPNKHDALGNILPILPLYLARV